MSGFQRYEVRAFNCKMQDGCIAKHQSFKYYKSFGKFNIYDFPRIMNLTLADNILDVHWNARGIPAIKMVYKTTISI